MRAMLLTMTLLCWPMVAGAQGPGCCQADGRRACCLREAEAMEASTAKSDAPGPARWVPGMMGMSTPEHDNIVNLLSGHATITRAVEEIPGGVKTTTTTSDPALVETLRSHVRQMSRRVEEGKPVRLWDPAFRDVFAHHDEITLTFRDIDDGIEVVETSENPEATAAIRAHAQKVDGFFERGYSAARPPWAGGTGMRRGPGMGMGRGQGRPGA